MKLTIYTVFALFALTGCSFFVSQEDLKGLPTNIIKQTTINFNRGSSVEVEVVATPEDRALGLGGRDYLEENSGMLFVYAEPGLYSFWMKGMRIPIDIIWLHEGRVIDITQSVPAPKEKGLELPTYAPKEEASLILEVNSGWTEQNSLSIGDEYSIDW
jgi:uncharacterized protein